LDDANVDALAGRLGVGQRQLRRLFRQHLGASPGGVALTRRVLLAKQLIHETHLPMTEVAFAAGFGSIRRFNETFRQLFGRSPRELRRTTAPEFSTAAAGELVLLLRYQPPYDWDATIAFLRAVLGQQITVVAAARLAGRMVAAYGEPLSSPSEHLTHIFP